MLPAVDTAATVPRLSSRGAATRARIVQAATELFFASGVAETSLDAVLAASGTSKSQLYHYFGDKDGLVLAVIAHQTELVVGEHERFLRDVDSLAGLYRWRDAVVAEQRRRQCVGGCPLGALAAELAFAPQPRAALADSFRRWESHLVGVFTRMRESDALAPEASPAELATMVLTALQGGLLLTSTSRSVRPLELALSMALEQVAGRLRAR